MGKITFIAAGDAFITRRLPTWTMEDGKITDVRFYPIDLGMDKP